MSESYGTLLRTARRARGWTLARIGEVVGVSTSYVADVESRRNAPFSAARTIAIARALETDPRPLLLASALERGEMAIPITSNAVAQRAIALTLDLLRQEPTS